MELVSIHELHKIIKNIINKNDDTIIEINRIADNVTMDKKKLLYYIIINNSEIYCLYNDRFSIMKDYMFHDTYIPNIIKNLKNNNILTILTKD